MSSHDLLVGMSYFARVIEDRWVQAEPLDAAFLRTLFEWAWDQEADDLDERLGAQLAEALSANLWYLDPDGLDWAVRFLCAYRAVYPTSGLNPFERQMYFQTWGGALDAAFVEKLVAQVYDEQRGSILPDAVTPLVETLSAHLDEMAPDGRDRALEYIRVYRPDGRGPQATTRAPPATATTARSTPVQAPVSAPNTSRQCSACAGSGETTCSSCGGMGGRTETNVVYDYDNNPLYQDQWVSCYACRGGYAACGICGGSGTRS